MTILHIDFETRGVLDLREVGLHRYARHPDTDVWCCAVAVDDGEPVVITPPNRGGTPGFSFGPLSDTVVYAHNAPFELEIWNQIMVPRYGWPELKPEQTFCTMAMCYAMSLPGALEDCALALGLHVLKDTEGRSLMLRMARPRSMDRGKPVWWDDADKLARLYAYCQQDVRVERELHKRLLPLSKRERDVWLLDYKINQRGVAIDVPSVKAAIAMKEVMEVRNTEAVAALTDGAVLSATALPALKEWMASKGVKVDSLAKQAVVDLLAGDTLTPRVAKVLQLRQEGSKASTAKFDVMAKRVGDDGRLRQTAQYHGAATGRWAGRGVQVHNLKRGTLSPSAVESALRIIRRGAE